uniref:Uncharacterized protein n=1 Tax=Panagrolaimus davidi TaxID=227884 RepID=A0A914PJI2_9BILA
MEGFGEVVVEEGFPGDQPEQYIGKDLGGSGFYNINVFPLDSKLNITQWKNDQAAVYKHIKNNQNCFARLFYGINYDDNNEEGGKLHRPFEIYYHYKLYQNNTEINGNSEAGAEIAKETIEGKLINLYP